MVFQVGRNLLRLMLLFCCSWSATEFWPGPTDLEMATPALTLAAVRKKSRESLRIVLYRARVEKFLLDLKLDLTWSLQAEQSKDCLNISIFNSALLCSAWLETFKSAWKCEAEAARKFEQTWIFYSSNSSKTAQAEHFAWNFYNE